MLDNVEVREDIITPGDISKILQNMDVLFLLITREGKVCLANECAERTLNYQSGEMIGLDAGQLFADGKNFLPKELPSYASSEFQRIYDKSEDDFWSLIQSAPLATLIISETGDIKYSNSPAQSLLGAGESRLNSMHVKDFIAPKLQAKHEGNFSHFFTQGKARFMGSGLPFEVQLQPAGSCHCQIALVPVKLQHEMHAVTVLVDRFSIAKWEFIRHTRFGRLIDGNSFGELDSAMLCKQGEEIPMLISGAILEGYGGGSGITALIAKDVSQLHSAQQELILGRRRFNESQKIAKIGSWELDLCNNNLYWSEGVFSIFEIDSSKFGASYDAFLNAIHPDDRAFVNKTFSESVENKTSYEVTHRLLMKDGRVKVVSEVGRSFYDSDGTPVRSVGTVQDITEQSSLKAEKELLARQLRSSEKLNTLGTLVGGVAHDFNNVLSPIYTALDLAQLKSNQGDLVERELKIIYQAAEHARKLVKKMLLFSKQEEAESKPVHLDDLLVSTLDFIRSAIPDNIVFELDISHGLPLVNVDPIQIEQVIINLITNAWQALGTEGGEIAVKLSAFDASASPVKKLPRMLSGRYLRLDIRDNGCGIDPGVMDKLFDPFFSTKEVDKGTGLGLSVVHGIVQSHGGEIFVESTPGEGSCFSVFIPLLERSITTSASCVEEEVPNSFATILLVDDNPVITETLQELLLVAGYSATTAACCKDAVCIVEREHVDLVVTDLTMPGSSGIELAECIQACKPGTPVIIMTGNNTIDSEVIDLEKLHVKQILQKPVAWKEFSQALEAALGG